MYNLPNATLTNSPNHSNSTGADLNLSSNGSQNNDICSICWETLKVNNDTTAHLDCSHRYHTECITSHFSTQYDMRCPLCRNDVQLKKGNVDVLTSFYQKELTTHPKDPTLYTNLAFTIKVKNNCTNNPDTFSLLSKATELSPNNPENWLNLANNWPNSRSTNNTIRLNCKSNSTDSNLQDYTRLACYKKVIELDPTNQQAQKCIDA